jgi:hypothetical protein
LVCFCSQRKVLRRSPFDQTLPVEITHDYNNFKLGASAHFCLYEREEASSLGGFPYLGLAICKS